MPDERLRFQFDFDGYSIRNTIMHKHPIHESRQIAVSDRVTFSHAGRKVAGYVARKGREHVHVICDDETEYRVAYTLLSKVVGAGGKHVQSSTDKLRSRFRAGDRVSFELDGRVAQGTISRLNPKAALVVCDDDREFRVTYGLLNGLESQPGDERSSITRSEDEVAAIAARAREHLNRHGLCDWSFQFDHATRRAGCCDYRNRVISLTHEFARAAPDGEIEDTILHETAHALAGESHGHDAVWRAKALEIGCSGSRCHDVRFTPPRYIVRCENRCWVSTAERRRRGAVCRKCEGRVVYSTYTEQRWEEERQDI